MTDEQFESEVYKKVFLEKVESLAPHAAIHMLANAKTEAQAQNVRRPYSWWQMFVSDNPFELLAALGRQILVGNEWHRSGIGAAPSMHAFNGFLSVTGGLPVQPDDFKKMQLIIPDPGDPRHTPSRIGRPGYTYDNRRYRTEIECWLEPVRQTPQPTTEDD